MIPCPLNAQYIIRDKSRKYATKLDFIIFGLLFAISSKIRVLSASILIMLRLSTKLRYFKGLSSKTSEYIIRQAIFNMLFRLLPRL
jgi:hypothetical protein